MTFSSLHHSILPAVLLSGTVFTVATLPLATAPSNTISVDIQNQSVFSGTLDDLAVPYLGVAAAASLGVGMISVSMAGWRASTRKKAEIEEKTLELQRHLQAKEAELEALKFSQQRLHPDLVENFLTYETSNQSTQAATLGDVTDGAVHYAIATPAPAAPMAVDMTPASAVAVSRSRQFAANQVMASVKTAAPTAKSNSAAAMPAAQSFQGFNRALSTAEVAAVVSSAQESTSEQLSELLTYLKQVMVQMEQHKGGAAS